LSEIRGEGSWSWVRPVFGQGRRIFRWDLGQGVEVSMREDEGRRGGAELLGRIDHYVLNSFLLLEVP